MIKRKTTLYFHQPTGNITYATKKQAKFLGPDWHKLLFVKNEKGEQVMRFSFTDARGCTATVDVKDNGVKEVTQNGDGKSE